MQKMILCDMSIFNVINCKYVLIYMNSLYTYVGFFLFTVRNIFGGLTHVKEMK